MTTNTTDPLTTTALTPTTPPERSPKTVGRVTVNLSRKTVEALDAVSELIDANKTEVINKAVQLFNEVQDAQNKGGGVWIQADRNSEPTLVRYR